MRQVSEEFLGGSPETAAAQRGCDEPQRNKQSVLWFYRSRLQFVTSIDRLALIHTL